MSVIGDTITILGAKLGVGIGGSGQGIELGNDLTTDRQRLIPGPWYYRISWAYTGVDRSIDANQRLHGYEITIWVHHRLSDASSERSWTRATGFEDLVRALGDPTWYRTGNADFYDFQRGADALVLTEPEREGNVVSFSARAKILLNR